MNKMNTKTMVLTALMAAVICILSPISIPIGPVPISLLVLAVLLDVYILGPKYGTLSYLVFLLIGLLGVPVFSGFQGGLQKLAGPTGGYLVGMIFTAMVAGWFIEHFPESIPLQFAGIVLGILLCYAFGTTWLMVVTKMSAGPALMAGVIPFIPFDAVKVVIAVLVGRPVRGRVQKFVRVG